MPWFAKILLATSTVLMGTFIGPLSDEPAAAATASLSGTTIPPAAQIVDAGEGVWTVDMYGICYRNGVRAGGCGDVAQLLYYQGSIYADTKSYGWWQFEGNYWTQIAASPIAPSPIPPSASGRWFGPTSVWNTPIPANVQVMSYSTSAISAYAALVGSNYGLNMNLDFWTPAYVEAPSGTPTTTVSWSIWHLYHVPLTADVQKAASYFASKGDSDSKVCLYSDDLGVFFDLEYVSYNGSGISVGAGAVNSATGAGWWDNSLGPWITATGASLCGGIIRPSEWAAGVIPHALAIIWPHSLALANTPVFPATTTDGGGANPYVDIPEGSLLQLDPTMTDAQWLALGVSSADLPIVHALQIYGGYIMDGTGGAAAIAFQAGLGASASLYPGAGPLPHAILSHLRVIAGPSPSSVAPLDSRLTMSTYISQ